jgi:hypothetical protein
MDGAAAVEYSPKTRATESIPEGRNFVFSCSVLHLERSFDRRESWGVRSAPFFWVVNEPEETGACSSRTRSAAELH